MRTCNGGRGVAAAAAAAAGVSRRRGNYRNTVIDGGTRQEGGDRDLTWRGSALITLEQTQSLEAGGQAQWLHGWRVGRTFDAFALPAAIEARDSWAGGGAWLNYRWAATPVDQSVTGHPRRLVGPDARSRRLALRPGRVAGGARLAAAGGIGAPAPVRDPRSEVRRQLGCVAKTSIPSGPGRRTLASPGSRARSGRSGSMATTARSAIGLRFERSEFRRSGNLIIRPGNPFWTNSLDGSASGGVITLERRQANGLSGWISFAAARTNLQDTLTGEQFVSDYDQAQTLNAYAIYRTARQISLSARYRYGSNFPLAGYYKPVSDQVWTLAEQRNQARLPAYRRLDLRADWAFTYRRSRLTLFTEIVNTTARGNYGPDAPTIRLPGGVVTGLTQSLFPFLPSAGVLIEF